MTINSIPSHSIPVDPLEATATAVHRLRPEWQRPGITAVLAELQGELEDRDLYHAAVAAAKDRRNRTPGSIRYVARDWVPGEVEQQKKTAEVCATCGKPPHACAWDRPKVRRPEDVDDHLYITKAELDAKHKSSSKGGAA